MWRAGPKQGRGLGGGWGLCLGPTGLEKALGGVGGGLRLNITEGAQVLLLPLVSEGGGPHLGAQQDSQAPVGGANALCSSGPGGPLLPAPALPQPPPMPPGPMWWVWGRLPWRAGYPAWELSRFPPAAEWAWPMTSAPLPLLRSRRPPPTCLS